jgi:hypothetical protein
MDGRLLVASEICRRCRRTTGAGVRPAPCGRERLEHLAGLDENRLVARRGLVAADDHIDIGRIELDAATDAPGLVGRDEHRAGAKKRVNDEVATIREIEKRVLCCDP